MENRIPEGYYIIEVEELDALIHLSDFEIVTAVYVWLLRQLRRDLSGQLQGIEIEIIPVTYYGTYPAIGVRYLAGVIPNVDNLIKHAASNILRKIPVGDLLDMLSASKTSWREQAKTLIEMKLPLAQVIIDSLAAWTASGADVTESRLIINREYRKRRVALLSEALQDFRSTNPHAVVCCLVEWPQSQTIVTLAMTVSGVVSLYFGSGGGVIGAGHNLNVRHLSIQLLDALQDLLHLLKPSAELPLPTVGQVSFNVLTFKGLFGTQVPEDDLIIGNHGLSQIFLLAQQVIASIRAAPVV